MVSIATVRAALPPFRNIKEVIKGRQSTKDIINEIIDCHNQFTSDYDRIYQYFDTGDLYSTCRQIWEFLKYNLRYNAETEGEQSSKSPAAILHPGERVDCKHYSLFIGGILDAIRRNEGDDFDWCYRFVSYYPGEDYGHVFVVAQENESQPEIWIDPVLTNFDQRKSYIKSKDVYAMSLVRISGVDRPNSQPAPQVTVNQQVAWQNFLMAVNNNMFSLKELLIQNPAITNGALRNYCTAKGFDYNQLLRFLNS